MESVESVSSEVVEKEDDAGDGGGGAGVQKGSAGSASEEALITVFVVLGFGSLALALFVAVANYKRELIKSADSNTGLIEGAGGGDDSSEIAMTSNSSYAGRGLQM